MWGKILYEHYRDMGSSSKHASVNIATDRMRVDFMEFLGKRDEDEHQDCIEIIHFDQSLEEGIIKSDQVMLGNDQILDADRRLFCPEGRTDSETIPWGYFIYNRGEFEEDRGYFEWINLDKEAEAKLVRETESIVAEFQKHANEVIARRTAKVGELYPIDPGRFFSDGYGDGIGPVFEEKFYVSGMYSCCDPSRPPKNGFCVMARTHKYEFQFSYLKNSPNIGNWKWQTGSLHIGRGNFGFEVLFDEQFDIRRICETGTSNIRIDKMYVPDDLKKGRGKILRNSVMEIWDEFREEFRIGERIELCESLTSEELSKAELIIGLMERQMDFRKFKDLMNAKLTN